MISNRDFVLYACIAKGTKTLAEFSREAGLEVIAKLYVEKTPPYHSMFSHTIRKTRYTYVISDCFLYFGIFKEDLEKSQGLWFLKRIKHSFEKLIEGGLVRDCKNLDSFCFQRQFDSIIGETMALDSDLDPKERQISSLVSEKGKRESMAPLLLKKKRLSGDVRDGRLQKAEVGDDVNGVRDLPVTYGGVGGERQKVKQVWKKHVWVVLILDIIVCLILLGIWLWVCEGLKCVHG